MLKINNERIIEAWQSDWDSIRKKVRKIDVNLCTIIDKLVLDDSYLFTIVSYPFGMDIIADGLLYFPLSNGEKIAINDSHLPPSFLKEIVGTNNSLIGLVLEKNCEYYLPMGERTISHNIAVPGHLIGFNSVLNDKQRASSDETPLFPHNLCAGAKNIFTLAPITDNSGFGRLQKQLNLKSEKPNDYAEQGTVFAEIANKSNITWRAEVVFLPNKLVERLKKDGKASGLYNYFLQLYRASYGIWHNNKSKLWDIYLMRIGEEMRLNHIYSTVLNTVKHVLIIAANGAPGFRPASDEISAPIKAIQNAYIKIYNILEVVNQFPVIMEPVQIINAKDSIYYSVSHPILSGYKSEGRSSKSIRAHLDLFMRVIDIYRNWISKSDAKIKIPSLYNAIMNHKFECYHPDPGDYKNIKNSALLFEEDPRFKGEQGLNSEHASFLKGCIKISKL